jgi:hypothetical protein
MPQFFAKAGVKEARLSIVVTRADGTVEDYGTVAYHNSNPLRLLWWRLTHRRR